jgi:hypothetical protein
MRRGTLEAMAASPAHHVTFRFRLPPALMLRAPVGAWLRAPRGVSVDVSADGAVIVTSVDHHETYARDQVVKTAARFLGSIDADVPMTSLPASLSAPTCRARPEIYAIALGAKVSIARTERAPHLHAGAPRPALKLVG